MEDEQIVALYWQRKEDAIARTEEKYGSYCRTIAVHILSNPEDTEECVNDTWLRTWNSIPPAKPTCFRLFLARITRNLALDRYRHQTADKRGGGQVDLLLEELHNIFPSADSAESLLLTKYLAQALNRFARSLSDKECSLFVRRYFYAETISEVAKRHHLSANHAAVLLSRIRKKLKTYLEQEGYL